MKSLSRITLVVFIIALPIIIPLLIFIIMIGNTEYAKNFVTLMKEAHMSAPLVIFVITVIFLFNYAFWMGFFAEEDKEDEQDDGPIIEETAERNRF